MKYTNRLNIYAILIIKCAKNCRFGTANGCGIRHLGHTLPAANKPLLRVVLARRKRRSGGDERLEPLIVDVLVGLASIDAQPKERDRGGRKWSSATAAIQVVIDGLVRRQLVEGRPFMLLFVLVNILVDVLVLVTFVLYESCKREQSSSLAHVASYDDHFAASRDLSVIRQSFF